MGLPLRAGRAFAERDAPGSLPVIVSNETVAGVLWPGQDPLGQIVSLDGDRTVVGVVGDVRHLSLEQGSGSEFYLPIRQTQDYSSVDLVVRTGLPTRELASRIREALKPLEPKLPPIGFRTVQQLVDKAASPRRFVVVLLGGFAGFALVLASLGIYALISYSVSQRNQEIGIRMALGASPAMVRRLILGETLRLAGVGVAIGLGAALVTTRLAAALFYDLTPTHRRADARSVRRVHKIHLQADGHPVRVVHRVLQRVAHYLAHSALIDVAHREDMHARLLRQLFLLRVQISNAHQRNILRLDLGLESLQLHQFGGAIAHRAGQRHPAPVSGRRALVCGDVAVRVQPEHSN